jgi:flavin reductase (DIM6/NTAB) family NADH-FMN oxidoreductase RutF
LVTTVDGDGNPNIITLGEIYNLSIRKPVIVGLGIAPQRYSHRLLCECREFVVNLPTSAILDKVLACGKVSGRDVRDKFAMTGLTPQDAVLAPMPVITI